PVDPKRTRRADRPATPAAVLAASGSAGGRPGTRICARVGARRSGKSRPRARHDLCVGVAAQPAAHLPRMAPHRSPRPPKEPVDRVLLGGLSLAAGGLATVAPYEVACAAALVLALAWAAGRARGVAALVVAVGLGAGALRAQASIRRHEAQRAAADASLPQPARCG